MKRAFFTACIVASSALLVMPAHAETLPAGVFRMADGAYFHALSRTKAPTLEALLATIAPGAATSTPAVSPAPAPAFPLLAAIERARAELRARIAAAGTAPVYEPEEAASRHVTLAIWNPATDALRYVDAVKQGMKLSPSTPDAAVEVVRTNGINSAYRATGAPGEVVVGIRYPIYRDVSGGKETRYLVENVSYVPYSSALQTPEMVAEGRRWLDGTVRAVFDGLRAEGVGSAAYDDALLADAVDPGLVKSILAIEHLDLAAIQKYPEQSIGAFLTVLGINKDASFNYSRSSAGAFGMAQFIPKTYASLAARPELKLNPDFEGGLSDPANAIRAQVAYLDYIHSRLPDATLAAADEAARDLVHEYLAASYNGGYPIVIKAMRVWPENLDPQERSIVRTRSRLKLETMQYVLKLRAVRDLFRTPPPVEQAST